MHEHGWPSQTALHHPARNGWRRLARELASTAVRLFLLAVVGSEGEQGFYIGPTEW